jgi:proteic killer suppression protein
MIKGFRHKGLNRFFRNGDVRGIQARQAARIARILDLLDNASAAEQLYLPGYFLHPLKGERQSEWAMTVSGNWRITFRFEGEDVVDVNLEDYH